MPGAIEERLQVLGIALPPPVTAVANYVTARRSLNQLWVSGHIPRQDGAVVTGRVGQDIDVPQARLLAREVAIDILSTAKAALGDLDAIAQVVKLVGMVNCAADFGEQSAVVDGASELMVQVFGAEHGRHARSAIGVASLPMGAALEIEAVFELGSGAR